jgi:hypothetical protein
MVANIEASFYDNSLCGWWAGDDASRDAAAEADNV